MPQAPGGLQSPDFYRQGRQERQGNADNEHFQGSSWRSWRPWRFLSFYDDFAVVLANPKPQTPLQPLPLRP